MNKFKYSINLINITLFILFASLSVYLSLVQYIHPDDILAFDMYQKIKYNGDLDLNSYRKVYGGTYPPMSCLITWIIIKFNLIPLDLISPLNFRIQSSIYYISFVASVFLFLKNEKLFVRLICFILILINFEIIALSANGAPYLLYAIVPILIFFLHQKINVENYSILKIFGIALIFGFFSAYISYFSIFSYVALLSSRLFIKNKFYFFQNIIKDLHKKDNIFLILIILLNFITIYFHLRVNSNRSFNYNSGPEREYIISISRIFYDLDLIEYLKNLINSFYHVFQLSFLANDYLKNIHIIYLVPIFLTLCGFINLKKSILKLFLTFHILIFLLLALAGIMPFSPTRHFVILILPTIFLMSEGINYLIDKSKILKLPIFLIIFGILIYHLSFTVKFLDDRKGALGEYFRNIDNFKNIDFVAGVGYSKNFNIYSLKYDIPLIDFNIAYSMDYAKEFKLYPSNSVKLNIPKNGCSIFYSHWSKIDENLLRDVFKEKNSLINNYEVVLDSYNETESESLSYTRNGSNNAFLVKLCYEYEKF